MLCFPAFTPVAKLAQATGDSEGLGRLELGERARVRQLLEIGQLALVHEPPGQRRVHAVEADDDDALLRPSGRLAGGSEEQAAPRASAHRAIRAVRDGDEAMAGPFYACGLAAPGSGLVAVPLRGGALWKQVPVRLHLPLPRR
jgi:hypothetical protein